MRPLTIGLLGPTEVPKKTALALLEDLCETNDPVRFIICGTEKHYTETANDIVAFLIENEVPYDLVVGEDSDLPEDTTENAASTVKVARPPVKVVSMLDAAKEDGDVALVIAWDDEDKDCALMAERAIGRGIRALDLTQGLDVIALDGEDDGDGEPAEEALAPAKAAKAEPTDNYDDLGVRKLRDMVEERLGLARKQVGAMDKPACIDALRLKDAESGAADAPAPEGDEDDDIEVADEAVEVMEEGDDPADDPADEEPYAVGLVDKGIGNTQADHAPAGTYRVVALEFAVKWAEEREDADVTAVINAAHRFDAFLNGRQTSPGRPRKDGTPAQPRS